MPRIQGFFISVQNGAPQQYDLDTSMGPQLTDETINAIAAAIAADVNVAANPPTVPYVEFITRSDQSQVTVTSSGPE